MAEAISRVLVVLPTYDERANLAPIVARVRSAVPSADILVVDDASPDGTGRLADRLAAEDVRVHTLHRPAKVGLGAAYVAGFSWGIDRGYDALVQLDADGSHQPEQIPALVNRLADADLVIGSRWVAGGSVENWPWTRTFLSRGGNLYTRMLIGLAVQDATGGFRAWRRQALEEVELSQIASAGYCFQVDLTRRAAGAGLRIVEVPILFVERTQGESKMSAAIVREALWRITVWGLRDRRRRFSNPSAWRRREPVPAAREPEGS
ncbi:MAG: polyprenol monophosphomannose synthase [Nocardioidaceae bacterium]